MIYERVAVTGAAGLIGSSVVRHLSSYKDIQVMAFDGPGAPNLVPGSQVPLEHVDVADPGMIEILESLQPKAVIHLAAHPGGKSLQEPIEDVRVNALGSMQVFQWCAKAGSHIVYLSSSNVYGEQKESKIPENAILKPGTIYGACKVACEQWLRTLGNGSGLSWTVVRPFATYGPGHKPSLDQGIVNILLTQLLKGDQVVVKGSLMRCRDLNYVEDMAEAIVQVLFCKESVGGIFNIGTGVAVTIKEILEQLCVAMDKPISQIDIIEEKGTTGDPFSNVADITQIKKILDLKPKYGLKSGLKELVAQRQPS